MCNCSVIWFSIVFSISVWHISVYYWLFPFGDITLTSQQLSCSAPVSSASAISIMMQQSERELQYRCGSVSGNDMGSSTESNSAVDGGQQAKHQRWKGPMPNIRVTLLDRSVARAHSSLRGSVEILGSIKCDLTPKLCEGARTHEISKAHKSFGEIPPGVKVIQIIKFFNRDPKSNLGKLKN